MIGAVRRRCREKEGENYPSFHRRKRWGEKAKNRDWQTRPRYPRLASRTKRDEEVNRKPDLREDGEERRVPANQTSMKRVP